MKNSSLWMVVGLVACFAACDDEVSTTDTGSGGSGATGGAGGATTTSEGGGQGGAVGQGGAGGAACIAPAAPSGAVPADMATDVDAASTTTLDWDDVPNAAGYDVYFGACPAPDYPSASYQRVTDSELTGQTLTSSTTYCWKVVSAADAGNTCVTEGDAWTFETACDDPVAGAPTLTMRAASYPACTTELVYTLETSEPVVDIASHVTLAATTGSGTVSDITSLTPLVHEVTVSGVADGDAYTLTVDAALADTCGNTVAAAETVDVLVGTPITLFEENFDAFMLGPTDGQGGWSHTTLAMFEWRAQEGGTSSPGTGPLMDHTSGTGRYVYSEASGALEDDVANFTSPAIDLSTASSPALEFWFHMFGTNMGTLRVEVDDGTGSATVWSRTGNFGLGNAGWQRATVDLSDYAGDMINVRFVAVRGADFDSDAAIDDVWVYDYVPSPAPDGTRRHPRRVRTGDATAFDDAMNKTPTEWTWDFTGNGNASFESGTTASDEQPAVSVDADGAYAASLVASNAFGTCEVSDGFTAVPQCPPAAGLLTCTAQQSLSFDYSYGQTIYLADELCGAESITTLSWEHDGAAASTQTYTIYIGHTTKTSFDSATDWVDVASLTQVFTGTASYAATPGFATITLDTPFAYNGTDHLVIAVDRNTNAGGISTQFRCEEVANDRSLGAFQNGSDIDPASPGTGVLRSFVPNLLLD